MHARYEYVIEVEFIIQKKIGTFFITHTLYYGGLGYFHVQFLSKKETVNFIRHIEKKNLYGNNVLFRLIARYLM